MSDPKTKKNRANVVKFIDSIDDDVKREDCRVLLKMMKAAAKCDAEMWGASIVGFGSQHFPGASGKGSDWFRIGFSPRKQSFTLYIMNGVERYEELLSKLGKHSLGKSCLYIKRLSDVDTEILNELIKDSVMYFEKKYGKNK